MNSKSANSQSHVRNCSMLLSVFCAAILGCGSSTEGLARVTANGIVTLDGEPLDNGTIRFIPSGSTEGPKVSVAITNGFFQFPKNVGPVAGQYRIEIEAPEAGSLALDDEQALERLHQQGRTAKIDVLRIPAVYNSNSRLTADLTMNGPNDLTFELLSKPE